MIGWPPFLQACVEEGRGATRDNLDRTGARAPPCDAPRDGKQSHVLSSWEKPLGPAHTVTANSDRTIGKTGSGHRPQSAQLVLVKQRKE